MSDTGLTSTSATLLALAFLGVGAALVSAGKWSSGQRRALLFAERSGLPILPVMIAVVIADAFIVVRRPVFTPEPGAPRVAHVRALRAVDYLGRGRIALPWILALGAAVMTAAAVVASTVARNTPLQLAFLLGGVIGSVVALGACTALPLLDRRILASPQRASTPVDLAWDDVVRTASMNTVRLAVSSIGLFAAACTISAYIPAHGGWSGLPFIVASWLQLALGRVLPADGRGLAADLRPATPQRFPLEAS